MAKTATRARKQTKSSPQRTIRCYLCGHEQNVSGRAMSTNCPACHKAIRIEDLIVKTYVPVNDYQTCGKIKVMKKGRIAAKLIQSGDGIECEGVMHGAVDSRGVIVLGPKAEWKGALLEGPHLEIADGASLDGHVRIPRPEEPKD